MTHAILATQAIVLVPFFIRAWGVDGYGRWLALTALVFHLTLLDLGGQNYIANLLAMRYARGEQKAFRKALSEAVSLFLLIGLVAFIVLLMLVLVFSGLALPGLGRSLALWEAWVLGLLGAHLLLLAIPRGVYGTVYRATGLFSRGAMVGNVVRGLGIGVSVGLLYALVKPEVYAAAMLAMEALLTFAVVWDTRRCIPGCYGLRISVAEARKGWAHLGGSIHFWLMALGQVSTQQGVLLILAASTSPAVVTLFATHRTLASIPNYTLILVQGPLLPELSFLWAQERLSELRRATFIAIRTVSLVTGALAILTWLVAPLIYPIWTGKHLHAQPTLLGLLLVQGVLAAGWTPSTWGLLATNHHRRVSLWCLANAAITVGISAWLAGKQGAVGVALAGLIGDLICGVAVFPVLASSFLKVSATRVYLQIVLATLMLLPFVGIAILMSVLLEGWWSFWGFVFPVAGLAYLILRFAAGQLEARRGIELLRAPWV